MDVQLKANLNASVREGHGSAASYAMSHQSIYVLIGSQVLQMFGSTSDGQNIVGCLKSQESERNHVSLDEAKIVIIGIVFYLFEVILIGFVAEQL